MEQVVCAFESSLEEVGEMEMEKSGDPDIHEEECQAVEADVEKQKEKPESPGCSAGVNDVSEEECYTERRAPGLEPLLEAMLTMKASRRRKRMVQPNIMAATSRVVSKPKKLLVDSGDEYGVEWKRWKGWEERCVREQLDREYRRVDEGEVRNLNRVLELQASLEEMERERCMGAALRSKAEYVVEGERSTKFFFGLEGSRQKARCIEEVMREDGIKVRGEEDIVREVYDYYAGLFRSGGVGVQAMSSLLTSVNKKLSEEDVKICDV
ncbi:hypothetical protein SKAU_G00155800 [Synaphobranchus kaupii]|uniref:Uncharacterized protein n=1 Tax=Synaphobranchus kaupii TaxID=118154 RepID=A0A9Q1IZ95_SYNKA|nr:hypothetical protein SKAU_G00155800 [Synaphobranchus kaupii]